VTTTPSIEITRHYKTLSEKETDDLVGTVADMLVTFIKNRKNARREIGPSPEHKPEIETQHTGR